MRTLPKPAGFTLIELLIVIVIIGLLAVIAMSVFWRAKDRGFEASLQADLKTASVQQENYFEAHRRYAGDVADLPDYGGSPGVTLTITYAGSDGWAAIATHHSLERRCGMFVGNAPAGSAGPAGTPGVVQCGDLP